MNEMNEKSEDSLIESESGKGGILNFGVEISTRPGLSPKLRGQQASSSQPQHYILILPSEFGTFRAFSADNENLAEGDAALGFTLQVNLSVEFRNIPLEFSGHISFAGTSLSQPMAAFKQFPLLSDFHLLEKWLSQCITRELDYDSYQSRLKRLALPASLLLDAVNEVFDFPKENVNPGSNPINTQKMSPTKNSENKSEKDFLSGILDQVDTGSHSPKSNLDQVNKSVSGLSNFIDSVGVYNSGARLRIESAKQFQAELKNLLEELQKNLLSQQELATRFGFLLGLRRLIKKTRRRSRQCLHILPYDVNTQQLAELKERLGMDKLDKPMAIVLLDSQGVHNSVYNESQADIIHFAEEMACPLFLNIDKKIPDNLLQLLKSSVKSEIALFVGQLASNWEEESHTFFKPSVFAYLEAMLNARQEAWSLFETELVLENQELVYDDKFPRTSAAIPSLSEYFAARQTGMNLPLAVKNQDKTRFGSLLFLI